MIKFFKCLVILMIIKTYTLANSQNHIKYQQFALEYFRYKNVQHLIYLPCNHTDNEYPTIPIEFFRNFLNNHFFIQIINNPIDLRLNKAYRNGIVVDSQCLPVIEFLKIADLRNFFTTNNFWFLYGIDIRQIGNIVKDIFITPDSDMKILIASNQSDVINTNKTTTNTYNVRRERFSLVDCYKICDHKEIKFSTISDQIYCPDDMIKSLQFYGVGTAKRKNLENIEILCGVVIELPDVFIDFDDMKNRHINTISKVNYPLAANLRQDLNFSFNMFQVDNWGWNHNGTFDGMMGYFQRNEIGFGINALFMRLDRINLTNFVSETFNIRAFIIFRQPPLSAVSNIFTLPFGSDVWTAILIFIIVAIIIMIIDLICNPIFGMNFLDCIMLVWGAVCQQGIHVIVTTISGRFILFTTFMTTFFLFTSYSANIVALLQSPSDTIASIQDLIHSPLELAAQDVKYNKVYFKEITDPITQALFNKKIEPKGDDAFIRPNLGMDHVRQNLFAYQVESQAAYQIISDKFDEHEKCGLKELEPFKLPVMSIPVKKTFPYKELFRQRLRWQRETGLMNREYRKWFPQKPQCENNIAGFVSIGLTESRYPLQLFGVGVGLSIVILFVEIIFNKLHLCT